MGQTLHKSEFILTKDTPYPALTGEIWVVYCEDFWENWSCYKGTTLYISIHGLSVGLVYVSNDAWLEINHVDKPTASTVNQDWDSRAPSVFTCLSLYYMKSQYVIFSLFCITWTVLHRKFRCIPTDAEWLYFLYAISENLTKAYHKLLLKVSYFQKNILNVSEL